MAIYQVTHKMRWLLQECRNIYYYETQVGNPSTAEWVDIVDEIRADIVAEIDNHLSDEWAFYAIDYRIVDTAGLLSFEAVPTSGLVAGTAVGESLATQVAMLVGVKGDTVKPNRARTYLSGLTVGSVVDSLFIAAARAAAETFIDLQTVLNSGGTNPLQRVAAQWNSSHTQVVATNNIAGAASVASIVPATQRRRRIGVGV